MEPQFNYGNKSFPTQKELFSFLFKNKKQLVAQKRAVMKKADCVSIQPSIIFEKSRVANKAGEDQPIDPMMQDTLKVVCIINTTNFLDCHGDVHIPGLWTKSLQENKMLMHLQEHEMEFEKIISDGTNLKAYTRSYTWAELGFPYEGITEGLTFESTIEKKRNEFMLNQYANGWVRNHSVGMYYVKMDMAINDEEYPNEFEAWKKYYPMIANSEKADDKGYFWYVLQAKCVEGSAVPLGSNMATPTMTVECMMPENDMPENKPKKSICPNCQASFDYLSVPESGMGYIECPNCKTALTQNTIEPSAKTLIKAAVIGTQKTIDYSYLLTHLKN